LNDDSHRRADRAVEIGPKAILERAQRQIEAATRRLEQAGGAAEHDARPDAEEWVDKGIVEVPVADLPDPEGITGEDDFQKVTEADMAAGLARLQEMQPAIRDGGGKSTDYWNGYDRAHDFDYEHGYQRIYDAFYGDDAIRLNCDAGEYEIVNGRHRIWLAKQNGQDSLPARVIERAAGDK